jgi:hypothetical protein
MANYVEVARVEELPPGMGRVATLAALKLRRLTNVGIVATAEPFTPVLRR